MDWLVIRKPDDFHLHLRQAEMLRLVLGFSAETFGRGLVMPNTLPPVLTAADALRYKAEIKALNTGGFEPLMTIKLTAATTATMIREAKQAGVIAAKLYPEGVTTNSADGVSNFEDLGPVFEAMQSVDMVLSLHGEMPGVFVLDRERAFLKVLQRIVANFPRLRVVLEHVSTVEALECVGNMPETVTATITVHHLILTLDDVIGDMLEPHHFCKPIAKREVDRAALMRAATSGNPKFFLGTDSAPHERGKKESSSGCAGVFTASVALPLLAEMFESEGALERLEAFASENGAHFYGLELNQGQVKLERRTWMVPASITLANSSVTVVPLRAGKEISWMVSEQ